MKEEDLFGKQNGILAATRLGFVESAGRKKT